MAFNLFRRLGTISYEKNGIKSFDLPRNYAYRKILLKLNATVSIVTAATTSYTEAAWKLIRKIEVIAGGKDAIVTIDGPALARMAHFFNGVVPVSSTVPTAVGASQSFEAFLPIDFESIRSVKPIDTLLNAFMLKNSTLELKITLENLKDPQTSIHAGTKFLGYLIKKYPLDDAIQMYNLGETKFRKGLRSQEYLKKFKAAYAYYGGV